MRERTSLVVAAAILATAGSFVPLFGADVVKLSPEKVVELAKTQSVVVKASEYGVKAQENAVKSVATGFFPSVSASGSAMHYFNKPEMALGGGGAPDTSNPVIKALSEYFSTFQIETPSNLYNIGINVNQPIFLGGKLLNGYRSAKFGLEAQKYNHKRVVEETGLSALKMYWGYVGAVKSLESIRETRRWFETLIADQRKMFDNGLIIELDVLNSKIQLDNIKLTEVKLENSIKTISEQMLLFLGLPQGAVVEADTSLLAGTGPVARPADSVDGVIEKRDDLAAMKSQVKALRALKGGQLASYWPTVAAFASYGTTNQSSVSENDMQLNSMIGVQLSWTLLDWGKAWRDAQQTQCRLQAAQLQADNLREQIRLKYHELARKVDEATQSCAIAEEDLETARKALAIAKLKYDAQAITNTELLNARNQLTGKMVAYAQARINLILAAEEFKVAPLSVAGSQGDASGAAGSGGTADGMGR
jgi:outer membrane protein